MAYSKPPFNVNEIAEAIVDYKISNAKSKYVKTRKLLNKKTKADLIETVIALSRIIKNTHSTKWDS